MYESECLSIMKKLVVGRDEDIGVLFASYGYYEAGLSARNNARKTLKNLVRSGDLVEGDGYFALPSYQGSYKSEHGPLVTQALVGVLKVYPTSEVIREREVKPIRLIPDALVLLRHENKGRVLIIEAVNNEFPQFFQQKVRVWENWEGACDYLKFLFQVAVPHFEICCHPEAPIDGIPTLKEILEEIP